jgi:hypothetical protein
MEEVVWSFRITMEAFSNRSGEGRIAGMSSRCEVGVDKLALELDY